jgi:hypothetical protein
MSRAELDLAARRLGPDVRLVEADAAQTGIPTASQDAVVSHMALMLMRDVSAVLADGRAHPSSGGSFAAVVGRRGAERSVAAREFYEMLRTCARKSRERSSGPRTRGIQSNEGIESLFAAWKGARGRGFRC